MPLFWRVRICKVEGVSLFGRVTKLLFRLVLVFGLWGRFGRRPSGKRTPCCGLQLLKPPIVWLDFCDLRYSFFLQVGQVKEKERVNPVRGGFHIIPSSHWAQLWFRRHFSAGWFRFDRFPRTSKGVHIEYDFPS